jgi:murein L,D-transpeptidase YafK
LLTTAGGDGDEKAESETAHARSVAEGGMPRRARAFRELLLKRAPLAAVAFLGLLAAALAWRWSAQRPDRAELALRELGPTLETELRRVHSRLGAPAFVRIFKQPGVLELWALAGGEFVLFRRYPICRLSGELGPKTREGDRQAPEGLYRVTERQLNAQSRFYLSFDLGYPNALEVARGHTGSALMVHGSCVSVGCYAMGDDAMREIFTVLREALRGGQEAVWVQALPFPLTPENLRRQQASPFAAYWRELEPAYAAFERERRPPDVEVSASGYAVR